MGVSEEVFDSFARQIQHACMYASMTDRLLAMQSRLAEVGRRLEKQGRIEVHAEENYAEAALNWLASKAEMKRHEHARDSGGISGRNARPASGGH